MKDCIHESLIFASGDYYLYCPRCKRQWVICGDKTIGDAGKCSPIAAELSGEYRIAERRKHEK